MVFVTHNYPRSPGDLPGRFLHVLARGLRESGVDVRVVAPADRGQGGREPLEGVPVRRVRYGTAAQERWAYTGRMAEAVRSPAGLAALRRLWRALREGARDEAAGTATVVHAHWWIPAGLAAPPELPMVVTVHGTDARLVAGSAAARVAARSVFRRAAVVTAVSAPAAAALTGVVSRELAVQVQPMPVDSRGWPWSGGGGGILAVGRLTPQKRTRLAIEALAVLRQGGRDVRLTVGGDGPERARLERLAAAHALEQVVRFTGALPFEEVLPLLGSADVALQTGRQEGLGLAAAEALMSGVPVVACLDGGGLLDVVPPRGPGRVADPEPEALAGALAALLDDPDARPRARELGAEWRQRLDPSAVAARFAGWYGEALRG